jgi:hypothetical protein
VPEAQGEKKVSSPAVTGDEEKRRLKKKKIEKQIEEETNI